MEVRSNFSSTQSLTDFFVVKNDFFSNHIFISIHLEFDIIVDSFDNQKSKQIMK